MGDDTPEAITVSYEIFRREIMAKLSPEQKGEFLRFIEALISLDDSRYLITVVLDSDGMVMSWHLNTPVELPPNE
jgi:hypothetical protein